MSIKVILLLAFDIFVAFICIRIIFGTFKEFRRAIYYLIKPDLLSILQKDFTNDFNYTHKMLFFILIVSIVIVAQIHIFH